jgi:Cu/Zn superoxide dismutase
VFRSTPTMMSVLASASAVLAIGLAPSAAATVGVLSALVSGYATGAHSTHIHRNPRKGTASKQGSVGAAHSAAPVASYEHKRTHPSACAGPKKFRVDSQGRPMNRPRSC